jgi:damage-control phosphatase, subfamily I
MKTFLECYPCFMRQALEAARKHGLSEDKAREVLVAVGESFRDISLDMTPPEIGRPVGRIIREHTGSPDPYREDKREFTKLAKELYPRLTERVRESPQPLFLAAVIAIVGNIIDLAALSRSQVRSRLEALLSEELDAARRESRDLFAFDQLRDALDGAVDLLYIGDNAGETVFDRVFIETIRGYRPEIRVRFAVRGTPILNDAIREDAEEAGLGEVATIVSSGSDIPGTVLPQTTEEFQRLFRDADMVIAKGQGNYESLSDADRDLFFLLVAKCPVIARDIGCQVGDVILLHRVP